MTASMDRLPALDLTLRKGTRMSKAIQVQTNGAVVPFPAGTKAKMQIRTEVGSATVEAELTTENDGLVIDEANALVTINISTAMSNTFAFERAVYDLVLIYTDNEKDPVVEGKLFAFPGVTQ